MVLSRICSTYTLNEPHRSLIFERLCKQYSPVELLVVNCAQGTISRSQREQSSQEEQHSASNVLISQKPAKRLLCYHLNSIANAISKATFRNHSLHIKDPSKDCENSSKPITVKQMNFIWNPSSEGSEYIGHVLLFLNFIALLDVAKIYCDPHIINSSNSSEIFFS